ncbi:hypothetical protein ACFL5Z_10035 [Planctomycetota bacterium]
MWKRLMCLISFLLVLVLTGHALGGLVDYWKLDEGSGNTAITGGASRSMCLWFNTDGEGTGSNGRGLFGWGTPQGSGVRWELAINMQGDPRVPGALRINASSGTRTCQTVVTDSEASLILTVPRDWAQASVAELSLWFRGSSGNAAESLYLAVSNSAGVPAAVAYDDPSAVTIRSWTQWDIPLQTFVDQGINLTDVNSIAIGLGNKAGVTSSGGSGTVYFDDIRLHRSES